MSVFSIVLLFVHLSLCQTAYLLFDSCIHIYIDDLTLKSCQVVYNGKNWLLCHTYGFVNLLNAATCEENNHRKQLDVDHLDLEFRFSFVGEKWARALNLETKCVWNFLSTGRCALCAITVAERVVDFNFPLSQNGCEVWKVAH